MPDQTPGKPLVAAIIPAFNEQKNIAGVLEPLQQCTKLDEIIVVDDGSDDRTVEIFNSFKEKDPRFQLIHHDRNLGKGQSVFDGAAAASAQILLLLDADLHMLTLNHIQALLEPVLEERFDMTIGLFYGGHFITDLSHWITPFLSGQRALRAEILDHISHAAAAGYGFEVALTIATNRLHYRKQIVPLKGMWHPPSEFHRGGLIGLLWRLRMYGQIIRGWFIATRERTQGRKTIISPLLKQ
jgi:glycosyltransferase involved in cell wall biosynthesis